ncbi:hypothetical protein O3M35_012370 [Rhynocoris fuscipes]|uniref:Uncharacterized protein n=1 Tax=Rhynocoris fuscipes TaxID=488301 RepID=A0AAW1CTK3_9HEMI
MVLTTAKLQYRNFQLMAKPGVMYSKKHAKSENLKIVNDKPDLVHKLATRQQCKQQNTVLSELVLKNIR